jgi:probable HAF family extracellular repeat protein
VADINNRGQIVGSSETADGATHPFLWERGRMIDLATMGVDLAGMASTTTATSRPDSLCTSATDRCPIASSLHRFSAGQAIALR